MLSELEEISITGTNSTATATAKETSDERSPASMTSNSKSISSEVNLSYETDSFLIYLFTNLFPSFIK